MATKNNKKSLNEAWGPMIQKTTGVTDPTKIEWMSQIAHNQVLNEADGWNGSNVQGGSLQQASGAMGGAYLPYNTLYNTVGVGNVRAAGRAALTGADFGDDTILGSGDKFPSLLPIALKVAAKTIGFELVNTTPMAGPAGVLPYLDYVYSGSKQPFGATPAYDAESANPHRFQETDPAFTMYGLPHAFKATIVADDASALVEAYDALNDSKFDASTGRAVAITIDPSLGIEYIGKSRIDGDPMFKVLSGVQSLGDYFAAGEVDADVNGTTVTLAAPRLISMLEDSLQGFTGAGPHDRDPWFGTYQDGSRLYEPMTRGTGELQYPRQISLQMFTKNVTVGTVAVSTAVTQEQVQDLQKQWGIDVLKMVENACVNELSNTINRHITSRLFALGWKNHAKLIEVEGESANLNISYAAEGDEYATYAVPQGTQNEDGSYSHQVLVPLAYRHVALPDNAHFENRDTLLKRLTTNMMLASNWILQRGRYGAATFAVTNITVATALQSNAQYAFSPIANNIAQTGGSLYPIGTMFGMTIYVDPLMSGSDCRVLVGRKGGKDEPGTHFCPYIMAEKVQFIAEGIAAPKLVLKSRYALVDAGFFPETAYITFAVAFHGIV